MGDRRRAWFFFEKTELFCCFQKWEIGSLCGSSTNLVACGREACDAQSLWPCSFDELRQDTKDDTPMTTYPGFQLLQLHILQGNGLSSRRRRRNATVWKLKSLKRLLGAQGGVGILIDLVNTAVFRSKNKGCAWKRSRVSWSHRKARLCSWLKWRFFQQPSTACRDSSKQQAEIATEAKGPGMGRC